MLLVAKKKAQPTGFGARLRALRKAADLTQAKLGERIGVAYQEIARLERGDNEPNWATVLKLADALGVKTDAFRGGEGG